MGTGTVESGLGGIRPTLRVFWRGREFSIGCGSAKGAVLPQFSSVQSCLIGLSMLRLESVALPSSRLVRDL